MRIVGHLSDKLLGVVVPQISAGACCKGAGTVFFKSCGCVRKGVGSRNRCVVNCDCSVTCGGCKDFSNPACL